MTGIPSGVERDLIIGYLTCPTTAAEGNLSASGTPLHSPSSSVLKRRRPVSFCDQALWWYFACRDTPTSTASPEMDQS